MTRRKVAGINTNTLLLVGGGALLLYILMKPKTPTLPTVVYPAGYAPPTSNPTVALAGDATSVINTLFNNLF